MKMTNTHKESIIKFTSPLNFLMGFRTLASTTKIKLFIPFYHSVSNSVPSHLKFLYPVRTEKQFESDLEFLLKHFKPVDLKEIIEINNSEKKISNPVFHITFDDGLSEFHDIAAPILLKKGIPATCFLNSDFIDNQNLFYRFKTSILIDKLHSEPAGSPVWKSFHDFCKLHNLQHGYYRNLLLSIGYDKKYLLDDLALKTGINFNDYLSNYKPYLTSVQIQNLIQKGFTFGSHSIDHPHYSFLTNEEQIRQTKVSTEQICKTFNLNYRAFSFPFTDFNVNTNFFNSIYNDKIVDVTFGSAGIKKDSVNKNIQRFAAELENSHMKLIIQNELLYFIFLKMAGKTKISRN